MPSYMEVYVQEFRQISELQFLNPMSAGVGLNPEYDETSNPTAKVVVGDDQRRFLLLNLIPEIIVVGICLMLLIQCLFLIYCLKIESLKPFLKGMKNKMIWNGLINAFQLCFFKILMISAAQVELLMRDSPYTDINQVSIAFALIMIVLSIALFSFVFLG